MKFTILGSCVTRDIFNLIKEDEVTLKKYVARSSIISVMSPAADPKNLLSSSLPSAFQQRMVEADIQSTFLDTLTDVDSDEVLIIDLIDERFDVLYLPSSDSFITLSTEIMSTGFVPEDHGTIVKSGSEVHRFLWERAWNLFVKKAKELNILSKIYLNRVFWGKKLDTGELIPGTSENYTNKNNEYIRWMYSVVEKSLPQQNIVDVPEEYFTSTLAHRWGPSPFHYTDRYYEFMANKLKEIDGNPRYLLPGKNENIGILMGYTDKTEWISLKEPASQVRLKIELSGSLKDSAKGLLLQFEVENSDAIDKNLISLNYSETLGWFSYITITSGTCSKDISVNLPSECLLQKIGLKVWDSSLSGIQIDSIDLYVQ